MTSKTDDNNTKIITAHLTPKNSFSFCFQFKFFAKLSIEDYFYDNVNPLKITLVVLSRTLYDYTIHSV